MAAIKVVQRTKPNNQGLYPIAIRITAERIAAFLYTDYYVTKNQWDKKTAKIIGSFPNKKRVNHQILKKYVELQDFIMTHDLEEERLTGTEIKKRFLNSKKKQFGAKFFPFADTVASEYRADEKFNEYGTFRSQMKYFKQYTAEDLTFEKITKELLTDFQRWLRQVRAVSPRTVTDYMIAIRLVYNRAIRAGLVQQKHYPFAGEGVRVQVSPTLKIGLSREEVQLLEQCTPDNTIPSRYHARCVWLFSFYLAGMRFTDVITLKKTAIVDGRIPYVMSKNAKPLNLKLPDKALEIVSHYLATNPEGTHLFPDMERTVITNKFEERRRIRSINRNINRQMSKLAEQLGIEKKVSMHIARHTFGNLAGSNVPAQLLQKLFNHRSLETTIGYQQSFIHDQLDDALAQVVK